MKREDRNRYFLLLQVNDALFPIGGYAHSYGLETYIQKGLVTSVKDAWQFLCDRLTYGSCYNGSLTAKLAYGYAQEEDLARLLELEELLEASQIPREVRQAGEKLGSRFVKTVSAMDIPYETDIFQRYQESLGKKLPLHAIVYGAFCAAAGIPREDALIHYLFAQTSAMVTNCVKTIPLSQTDGQRLLYKSQEIFQKVLERLEGLTQEDLCLSVPGFDIRCMQHEALYSRLYMS